MWSALNQIGHMGTTLLETTEQYAKSLAGGDEDPSEPTASSTNGNPAATTGSMSGGETAWQEQALLAPSSPSRPAANEPFPVVQVQPQPPSHVHGPPPSSPGPSSYYSARTESLEYLPSVSSSLARTPEPPFPSGSAMRAPQSHGQMAELEARLHQQQQHITKLQQDYARDKTQWETQNRDLSATLDTLKTKAKAKIVELQTSVKSLSEENHTLRQQAGMEGGPNHTGTVSRLSTHSPLGHGASGDLHLSQNELSARDGKIQQMAEEMEDLKRILVERDAHTHQLQESLDAVQKELQSKVGQVQQLSETLQQLQVSSKNSISQQEHQQILQEALAQSNVQLVVVRQELEAQVAQEQQEIQSLREQLQNATNAALPATDPATEELAEKVETLEMELEAWKQKAAGAERIPELEKALAEQRRLHHGSKLLAEKLKEEMQTLRSRTPAATEAPSSDLEWEERLRVMEEQLQQSEAKAREYAQQVAQMETQNQELREKFEQAAASASFVSDIAPLAEESSSLVMRVQELTDALQKAQGENADMETKLQESSRLYEQARMDLDSKESMLLQSTSQFNEMSGNVQALSTELANLQETNRTLMMQLEEAQSAVQHRNASDESEGVTLRQEVEQLRAFLDEAQARVGKAERERSELEATVDDMQQQLLQREQQIVHLSSQSEETSALQERLQQQQLQLQSLSESNANLQQMQQTVREKEEMIQALERQIAGLHKATMLVRTKDGEIEQLKEKLAALEEQAAVSAQTIEELEQVERVNETTMESLRAEISNLQKAQAGAAQKKAQEMEGMRKKMQELQLKSEQMDAFAKEAESLDASLRAKEEEMTALKVELAEAQVQISAYHEQKSTLASAEQHRSDLENQNRAHAQRIEEVTAQVDMLRSDLTEKDNVIQMQNLELDRLKEENASMLSNFDRELSEVKAYEGEKTQQMRQVQAELLAVKADFTKLQAGNQGLERTVQELNVSLADAESRWKKSKSELEQVSQSSAAQLDAWKKRAAEQESQVAQLTEKLNVATANASKSSSRPANDETVMRVQQEWLEKYRALEQENLRLRDRSMRVERMLDEQQRSRGGATGMRRSDSSLMAGVVTLPWLETKEEDREDAMDLEAPHSNPIRPRGGGVVRWRYLAQSNLRNVIRTIDLQSVRLGDYLRNNPIPRIAGLPYILVVHLLVILLLFV